MITLGNDKYATTSESESGDVMPPLEDVSYGEEHPTEVKSFLWLLGIN